MNGAVFRGMRGCWGILLSCTFALELHAGGSGLNTVVVVNQASSNSCELGNYFCERRRVPPQNVLRINWPGGNTLWSSNDFETSLVTPLLSMLSDRRLTNQIEYVVLSMDIPFETSFGATVNGTTSALFYGARLGNGTDPLGVTNSYAGSEADFRQAIPAGAPGYSFLATMITADTLAGAEHLVDQGVNGDGTSPQQPVVLAKSSDPFRNIRYAAFDNAVFNIDVRGVSSVFRTNADSLPGQPDALLGYETGLAQYSIAPGSFAPGAIGDSLTSFGGILFGPNSQTNLLAFINAGAAGSYGTVAEPNNDVQKFPDPEVYFYQARGFTLAESYYQSIRAPYLGLLVGEPLAAPFAHPGQGFWDTNIAYSVIGGDATLSFSMSAPDADHPLQKVDLFVDGIYYSTLTNVAPCPGNRLTVALNGYPVKYTVPANATISSVAAGLASAINDPAVTSSTEVQAFVHGDRIELQCEATNLANVPFYTVDTAATYPGAETYRAAYLPDSFAPQMIPAGLDRNGKFRMYVAVPTGLHYVILASTNLADWVPIFTNTVPGLLDFEDADSTNYPARFYRVTGPVPDQPPTLSPSGITANGAFQMHLQSLSGQPCAIRVSTNLVDWTPLYTNRYGGPWDFTDNAATNLSRRFYQAWLAPLMPPAVTTVTNAAGSPLLQVDGALRPYTVEVSTNGVQWTTLDTNFAIGQVQTSAGSALGSGDTLSTFLSASRSSFLASSADGLQRYTVIGTFPPTNAWIQFTFTKTNDANVVVGVTNLSGATSGALASQLCAAINANPALQGSDGVAAQDYVLNPDSSATFNLRARSAGYDAARLQATVAMYQVIMSAPQGSLTANLPDLLARNHLYVTAGAKSLALTFSLDTTTLPDGCHELAAVGYEGSHVRTQTRLTVPVWIQNTDLSATMSLLDMSNSVPVGGTYHVQVTANTNDVTSITLFSTGGALAAASNQPSATFEVYGTNLWAGLHPFYAIVETADSLRYRTRTRWVRFVNP